MPAPPSSRPLYCCPCRAPRPATPGERELLGLDGADEDVQVHEPRGCARCLGTGYRGRIGLFEALWVDPALTERIAAGANEHELTQAARDYWRLAEDARAKVLAGQTSLDEARPYLRLLAQKKA